MAKHFFRIMGFLKLTQRQKLQNIQTVLRDK